MRTILSHAIAALIASALVCGFFYLNPVTSEPVVLIKTADAKAVACPVPPLMIAVRAFEASHGKEIRAFQLSKGLRPDGVIGPATFAAAMER